MDRDKFNKFENESDISYIVRICGLKDESGYTWKELANEINHTLGLDYDESAYRKKFQSYKTCYEDKQNVEAEQKGMVEELRDERIKLKQEVYKLQTLRIDDNRKIREQARNDLYFQEVIRAIEDESNKYNNEIIKFDKRQIQDKDAEYILSFADIHFGKQFQSITNEYNIDIAIYRMNKLLDEIFKIIDREHISKLHVCALGDLIEGMTLRVSQLQSLQVGLVDQTIKFANYMIEWIKKLSQKVNVIYYSVMSSNHSQIRPYSSKPNEFVSEDMERVIFAMLENAFKNNPHVIIAETEEKFARLKLFNYNIMLLHGHEFKDMNKLLQEMSWKYHEFFDYILTAHLHRGGNIVSGESLSNNCEIIQVPSVMGTDEYADQLMVGSKPGALLIKFTDRQGKRMVEDIIL